MKTREKELSGLLAAMGRIERMERGRLCRMGSRPYFNLQRWEHGRNRVRYVPAGQVASVRDAIAGYERFMELARQYADSVVGRTRSEWAAEGESARNGRTRRKKGPAGAEAKAKDV